jgi:hypothetical protein
MRQKTRPPKNMLLATRITPKVRDSVVQLAQGEGLNVSEWLRNVIIMELKRADVLQSVYNGPNLRMELNDNE